MLWPPQVVVVLQRLLEHLRGAASGGRHEPGRNLASQLDRRGQPMTMKVKGTVEAWFLDTTEGTGAPDQNGG